MADKVEEIYPEAPRRLALSLSGGGFRATLFHLGVIRQLRDRGLLTSIQRIGAVSGGSIMAAHLVLNWERYTSDKDAAFEAAAQEVLDFSQLDVRGRVMRRWLLGCLLVIPRLRGKKSWTLTYLLQQLYKRLFNGATLRDLGKHTTKPRPQPFFYCTSLSTGRVCSFGRSGFMWDEEGAEKFVVAPSLPVAFAVAASSAFPPLFPPLALTREFIDSDTKDFPSAQYLTDGGIYDNLGIDRLAWYHENTPDIDLFLISDAEGNFDWKLEENFTQPFSRNVRANDILMKRTSTLRYQSLVSASMKTLVIDIDTTIEDSNDPTLLDPGTQRRCRNVRTDLDKFSRHEIASLVAHGQAVARQKLQKHALGTNQKEPNLWAPYPDLALPSQLPGSSIQNSHRRKGRLFSFRDLASWVTAALLTVALAAAVYPLALTVRSREREIRYSAVEERATALTQDLERIYRQRYRPLMPGSSAGAISAAGGTFCCVVKRRDGSGERFLLAANNFISSSSPFGQPILQPAESDGGRQSSDAVADLDLVFGSDHLNEYRFRLSLAKLRPEIDARNIVLGFGSIQGITPGVSIGETVTVRSTTLPPPAPLG